MTTAHINAIGTAVPPHQVHDAFMGYADGWLDTRSRKLFERMAGRAGIEQRFSFVEANLFADGETSDTEEFFGLGDWPSTGERMARYEDWAPQLAIQAIRALGGDIADAGITHLVVASCTGFVAPGIDQLIIRATGIDPSVERTLVGFMGCYAAVNSLRLAHHIVRSEPDARVLVVAVELCTLHFQRTTDLEKILSMMLFGDGSAAAIVSSEANGVGLKDFRSATIADSDEAISWHIRDQGFDMVLDGQVPSLISGAMARERMRNDDGGLLRGTAPEQFDLWAVHAGGRSVLDAVENGLDLHGDALKPSREVLRQYGNMSSATLLFVLQSMMADRTNGHGRTKQNGNGRAPEEGMAMAFGPGMAAESFRFQML
ncbi:MAG: type III polyketide synthase [Novosphingobium sp.]|nr:type III polyketide synthase [Novosphingobium sp.]